MTRLRPAAFFSLIIVAGAGCSGTEVPLETPEQQASYGIGLQMGRQLLPGAARMDMLAYRQGVEDALAGVDPRIPEEQLTRMVEEFSISVIDATEAVRDSLARRNSEAGQAYLTQNASRDGVSVSRTGLQYEVIQEGEGASPTMSDRVRVNYRGTLVGGQLFDNTYDAEPAEFDMSQLIPAWTEALQMMSPGSTYRLVVPPELAYGDQGMGRLVGPMATLIYEIELLEVLD